MIPLDDARWDDLKTAYHRHCGELLEWLHVAYNGNLTNDLLGDVINEIQHQGDTSTSMYAVAPHLLELATKYNTGKQSNGSNLFDAERRNPFGFPHARPMPNPDRRADL